jgi:hypothetical protein
MRSVSGAESVVRDSHFRHRQGHIYRYDPTGYKLSPNVLP